MKNSIRNIPFLKTWFFYFSALVYQLKSNKLKIGHLNELKNCHFGSFNSLGDRVNLQHVILGDYSYISCETIVRHTEIGKFSSIGPRCQIGLGKHPTSGHLSTHPLFYSSKPPISLSILSKSTFKEREQITIGNDVWIGANVIILDGVNIGNGAIIAAGSVVTKSVAPYSIVKGVPAKHSRYRFSPDQIDEIIANPWWEKSIAEIERLINK